MKRTAHPTAFLALTLLACGGNEPAADTKTTPATSTPTASGAQTPDPGGQVVMIEMSTDDKGVNKFSPSTFEVKPGDVLRFTLVTGVHNVNFPADSNPRASMPAAAAMLQLPGQTTDIKVNWAPGTYKFQCDPHALLGMHGQVVVK